jgi:PAS domain S-box-containing protein
MTQSKSIYEAKKKEFYKILDDPSLNAEQKIEQLKLIELTENLELHQVELQAQNKELQKIEQELLHSKEEVDEIFQHAPVAFLKLDERYNIIRYNKATATLLTHNKNSLKKGKSLNLFVHKQDIRAYINLISKLSTTNHVTGIIRFVKDSDTIYGRVNIQKLIKKELYYLVAIEDITNEVKNEIILLNSARNIAMGEMLSMITHQWKDPLAVISMSNSNLEYQAELHETINLQELQNTTKIISSQIEYMNDTLDDFRDFYGEDRLKQKINTQDCVARAVKFTQAMLKFNNIKLNIEYIDSGSYTIVAYPHNVCQILMNIITNAKDQFIKTDINEKIIDLKIYHKDENIIFALKNNGGIIPENIIDDIFNKSFSTKSNDPGNGLGLYISKKIADEHLNGKLWVENIKEEESVVFYLQIPLDS